ncbi:hypothetical protein [Shewanella sp. AC34-MNA-CIBAN-0136]|uniref:hypothetical protein n=1 Tax=Shewanella sp. AC34-MNA-CIBAN-0136 TaxID=3140463 RepID=UPI003316AB52
MHLNKRSALKSSSSVIACYRLLSISSPVTAYYLFPHPLPPVIAFFARTAYSPVTACYRPLPLVIYFLARYRLLPPATAYSLAPLVTACYRPIPLVIFFLAGRSPP